MPNPNKKPVIGLEVDKGKCPCCDEKHIVIDNVDEHLMWDEEAEVAYLSLDKFEAKVLRNRLDWALRGKKPPTSKQEAQAERRKQKGF